MYTQESNKKFLFHQSQTKQIELPGVPKDSFTALLEYLYSDQFSAEESDPHEVLILADRFCQQRLLQLCESHISRTLSCLLWKHNEELLTETVETLRVSQVNSVRARQGWSRNFGIQYSKLCLTKNGPYA